MTAALLINPTAMEAGLIAAAKARGLSAPRRAAFEKFSAYGMPHKRMEQWKWTDLRQALREDPGTPQADNDVIAPSLFGGVGAYELTIMNGVAEWSGAAPEGASITRAPCGAPPAAVAGHPLGNLVCAFADEVVRLDIPENTRVEKPILIRRIAGPGASHSRLAVTLGAGAGATIIESFDGVGAYFSNTLVEVEIAQGGTLHRLALQDGSDDGVEASLVAASLAARASFRQTALLLGAKAVRLETQISCRGEETRVDLDSAAVLAGARHADLTSRVDHEKSDGLTRQTHKQALRDKARGVFQGKFHVARGAQKTDAQMKAQALLLSATAEANHKPELEIYADDVQCAHGSTAGALDEEALFYMRQRGLSEDEARALLVEAFVGDVFEAIDAEDVREVFRRRLQHWLGSGA